MAYTIISREIKLNINVYNLVINQIPWVFQFILIRVGATRNILERVVSQNPQYCVDFRRRQNRINSGGLDCSALYGPWATFFGISVSVICSLFAYSNLTINPWVSLMGQLLALSSMGFILFELRLGRPLLAGDLLGYSLLGATLTAAYSVVSLLSSG